MGIGGGVIVLVVLIRISIVFVATLHVLLNYRYDGIAEPAQFNTTVASRKVRCLVSRAAGC